MKFKKIDNIPRVVHFITTRHGGVSEKEFKSLNFGLGIGDEKGNVLRNIELLSSNLKINPETIIIPTQVHGTDIVEVSDIGKSIIADSLYTAKTDICVCVKTADCLPIIVVEKTGKFVSVVHAGWRGSFDEILKKTLIHLSERFGVKGKELVCCFGPSIGPESYMVGKDIANIFIEKYGTKSDVIIKKGEDCFLDLWRVNYLQAKSFGIDEIEQSRIDVFGNSDFYSYREDLGKTGRFITGIMILSDY